MELAPTDKIMKYVAIFSKDGTQQITGWKRSRQQAIAALRRSSHPRVEYQIQARNFVSRKETNDINA